MSFKLELHFPQTAQFTVFSTPRSIAPSLTHNADDFQRQSRENVFPQLDRLELESNNCSPFCLGSCLDIRDF